MRLAHEDLEELREFLRDHVSTFEELETLLFFMRATPGGYTTVDVAAALGSSVEAAQNAVDGLLAAGVGLRSTSGAGQPAYDYAPAAELRPLLDKLQMAYAEQRLTIVQIMSSNALERVRSSAARRLADAFRLQRSKK